MGAAPKTVQKAELTPEEARDSERRWYLDAVSGELKPDAPSDGRSAGQPEGQPDGDPRDQPKAVRVARWIFD